MSKLEDALHEIAELGANAFSKYGCKSRADLIRHMDKMWEVAFDALKVQKEEENMSKPLEFNCED